MLPVITKPTRITSHIATLINHIYTNSFNQQTVSGIATVDISDYLPVFCISETAVKHQTHSMTFRDYSTFNEELYKSDIRAIDWNTIQSKCTNLHKLATKTIEAITVTADKHAPKKIYISKTKQKQLTKPWIINGILKSIKTKQRMYKTHFL